MLSDNALQITKDELFIQWLFIQEESKNKCIQTTVSIIYLVTEASTPLS